MRNRIGLGLLISIATGCSTQPRSLTDDDSHFFQLEPATSVEVYATGGIAGLVNDWRIVANTRAFTLPPPMREIVDVVRATIAAARK